MHALASSVKAGAATKEMYAPSITAKIRAWATLDEAARKSIVNAELESVFRILADFAFKMTNLVVSPATTRRFIGKMCTAANLDEERRKLLLQLVYNMSKMKLRENKDEIAELEDAQTKLGFSKGLENFVPVGIANADSSKESSWHHTFQQLLASDTRQLLLKSLAKSAGTSLASSVQPKRYRTTVVQALPPNMSFVSRLLEGHTSAVISLAHFPFHVASGSADSRVRVWDTRNGSCVAQLVNHTGWVNLLHLDHFAGRLLSGSYDRTVKLWDLSRMTKIRSLRGHRAAVSCLKTHPRGTLSASYDATVALWDVRSKRSLLRLEGHNGPVTCLCQRGEDTIVSGSRDSTLRIWDLRTGRTLAVLGTGHTDWVRCCVVIEEQIGGKWKVLSGGYDGRLVLWDPDTAAATRSLVAHDGCVNDLCLCNNGSSAVSAGADGAVKLWSTTELHCERVLGCHADEALVAVPFMDKLVATGSCDCAVKIWEPVGDQSSGRAPCRQTLHGHNQKVTCACAAGPSSLVTGSWDASIRIWEFSADFR